jgi:hypothetical protein
MATRIELSPEAGASLLGALIGVSVDRPERKERPAPRASTLDEVRLLIDQPATPFQPGTLVKWRKAYADPTTMLPMDFEGYVTATIEPPLVKVMDGGWAERYDVLLAVTLPCNGKDCDVESHVIEYPADSRRLEAS